MSEDPTAHLDGDEVEGLPDQLDDPEAAVPPAGPLRFARMSGSTIAGRDAAAWITDFLNAAYYYRHPVGGRDVDDLRLVLRADDLLVS
jgi:hypothetical protein